MDVKLIVNADDFGIHPSVNEAVCRAFEEGILTSTSLMANGAAFGDAVKSGLNKKGLGIGVHLTLVGGLPTVLPAEEVPSLTWEDGLLCRDYTALLKRDLRGLVRGDDVYREWDAQIRKILDAGILVTHIDGHQHMHMWRRFFPLALSLALKYRIPCMRVSGEKFFFGVHMSNIFRALSRSGLTVLSESHRKKLRHSHVLSADYFWGMIDGGHLSESRLLNILSSLKQGVNEIMCHPSMDEKAMEEAFHWGYRGETELRGLLSPRIAEYIKEKSIRLISYGDVYDEFGGGR